MTLSRRQFTWILLQSAALPMAACSAAGGGSGDPLAGNDGTDGTGGDHDASTGEPGRDAAMGGSDGDEPPDAGLPPVAEQPAFDFVHGVASGDPLTDRVILWTRITPKQSADTDAGTTKDASAAAELVVDFLVARDPALKDVVGHGRASTGAARDYTVKVDVTGLGAGSTYYYQFFDPADETARSPVGRTRTLPSGSVERARFAVVSCSCYAMGYFHSYADIAARSDLDAVLHLGDYIYEYGPDVYQDNNLPRPHDPAHEIITLDDYRTRYRQYRTDPDLQEAHRQHPFITVWDDHETANDAYRSGAENHTEGTEGSFTDRRTSALTAYHEWMPIRDLDPNDLTRIYRTFRFGDLVDLIMLETRTHRDKQDRGAASDAARTLTGPEEAAWLEAELSGSQMRGTSWRVLGNQVMMGQLELVGQFLNADQWDGYQASRTRLFDYITSEGIDNVVVLTGDIHSAWAMELAKDPYDSSAYDKATGQGALGVELVCTSITSPALEFLGGAANGLVTAANPHIKYVDLVKHGYCLVDVDPTRVQGEWYASADIKSETGFAHSFEKAFTVEAGTAHLVETKMASEPISGRPALV